MKLLILKENIFDKNLIMKKRKFFCVRKKNINK